MFGQNFRFFLFANQCVTQLIEIESKNLDRDWWSKYNWLSFWNLKKSKEVNKRCLGDSEEDLGGLMEEAGGAAGAADSAGALGSDSVPGPACREAGDGGIPIGLMAMDTATVTHGLAITAIPGGLRILKRLSRNSTL